MALKSTLPIETQSILDSNGFYCYYACSCTGTREEYFRHNPVNKLEFKIFTRKNELQTKINRRIVCITGIENLESEINKYM